MASKPPIFDRRQPTRRYSFNENEQIVDAPRQAIDCFASNKMDVLAMGSFVLEK